MMIVTDDHPPPHVHAKGPGCLAIFFLNCPKGPVTLRENHGLRASQETAVTDFLNTTVELLCKGWE